MSIRFGAVPRDETSAAVVGQVLSELRDELGLTQEDVAGRARVDRSYLSDAERGVTSLSLHKFLQICKGLGVPAAEVVARIEKALGCHRS